MMRKVSKYITNWEDHDVLFHLNHSQYIALHHIGSGSMGDVFFGIDTASNLSVAIKRLKPLAEQSELVERFRREGKALRELDHPNIVKLLNLINQDGYQYLILEYVPGGDLRKLLNYGPLPIQLVIEGALDLADALTRSHKLNIVHRDLKPANILIASDRTLRITDFGIAHINDCVSITNPDTVVGTPAYLPPEGFSGTVSKAMDCWALGVVMYEMIAGNHPFQGENVFQVAVSIVNDEPTHLLMHRHDVPKKLADLVHIMLDKEPSSRPHIRRVGADLLDILNEIKDHGKVDDMTLKFPKLNPDSLKEIETSTGTKLL